MPPVPAGFRERERERRERGGARPPGGGDNTNTAGVGGEDESVADKWREAVLSAVADLKTAQVRIVRICFWQAVSLCVFVRARVCHNGILQPPPPSPPLLAKIPKPLQTKPLQVRTLNLLTSLVRTFPAELEPQLSGICSALLDMFRSAPDCIAVRREPPAALLSLIPL